MMSAVLVVMLSGAPTGVVVPADERPGAEPESATWWVDPKLRKGGRRPLPRDQRFRLKLRTGRFGLFAVASGFALTGFGVVGVSDAGRRLGAQVGMSIGFVGVPVAVLGGLLCALVGMQAVKTARPEPPGLLLLPGRIMLASGGIGLLLGLVALGALNPVVAVVSAVLGMVSVSAGVVQTMVAEQMPLPASGSSW